MTEEGKLSEAEQFLKYNYSETKDLCKQFLTLITTVLVISLTFSEKIVDFANASITARLSITCAWISFLLAIILCGLGLLFITIAAGEAAYGGIRNWKRVSTSYRMIVIAGAFFIFGLASLISTAITTVQGSIPNCSNSSK